MIRVKICGITRREDALAAVELGAAALGFVFYPPSPRYISPSRAADIAASLPPFVTTVGVFVDSTLEEIESTLGEVPLSWIQLHGSESPGFCASLDRPVLKAFRVGPSLELDRLAEYRVGGYLLDGYEPRRPGGTGRTFDWSLARAAQRYGRIVLAGGITADNVVQAVEEARPTAIDVSSGVESEPGKKDHRKLQRLFHVVNELHRTLLPSA